MIIQLEKNIGSDLKNNVLQNITDIGYKTMEVTPQFSDYLVSVGKKEFDIRKIGNLPGVRDVHRVSDAYKLVSRKWKVHSTEIDLGDVHPNTVKFEMLTDDGRDVEVVGSSTGGGGIVITEIDGLKVKFTGLYPTLITKHKDHPGVIHQVTEVLANQSINVAYMSVFRQEKGDRLRGNVGGFRPDLHRFRLSWRRCQ